MKISLNTIKELNKQSGCADDIAPTGIVDLVEKIGAQLAAVENVTDISKKYEGVIIVKIVSCVPHPGADKLSICTIDDGGITPSVNRGDDGYVQVVCGAPNVQTGLTVVWLPPGTTVPESYDKEPFVLTARELRGVVSNGMLASAKELGLGDDHDGILEISEEIKPGSSFAEYYGLQGDHIIELENKMFTHRPDCFGYLGISRELAGIGHMAFKSPDWYITNPLFPAVEAEELPVHVMNEIPEVSQRFSVISMADVVIKPSPLWLQIELAKLSLRPINNIVDYTNFFMLLTGQPLHAYDYDKVAALSGQGATLVIRRPQPKEKIKLLNGKEVEPYSKAILIATDKQAIGIGGVMGGSETEVDSTTKNIILECANFDMYTIRRTAMANGLFTDAVTRFNKGQSPLQNLAVLARIVGEIRKFASGKVASPVVDDNHLSNAVLDRGSVHPPITLSSGFINGRLGLNLEPDQMATLLRNVEFKVDITELELSITAPFWRTDIEIPEDVVEEVGRLYGYDHVPLQLPKRDLTPVQPDPLLSLKSKVRQILAKAGANELLTYSFVHGDLIDKVGQDRDKAFKLANALSPELQYYRLSLVPSLLDKVHTNIKAGYGQFAIFEIGKTHDKSNMDQDGLPVEEERLALVFAADDKIASKKYAGAPYYQAKQYLHYLLRAFGTEAVFELSTTHDPQTVTGQQCLAPFNRSRTSYIKTKDGVLLGFVGELNQNLVRTLKLPQFTAAFELDLRHLASNVKQPEYIALSRFPKVQQDISLKVSARTTYKAVHDVLSQQLLYRESTHASLDPLDVFQRENDSKHKQMAFRFTVSHYQKTLTSEEVNAMLDQAAAAAQKELGAERI